MTQCRKEETHTCTHAEKRRKKLKLRNKEKIGIIVTITLISALVVWSALYMELLFD